MVLLLLFILLLILFLILVFILILICDSATTKEVPNPGVTSFSSFVRQPFPVYHLAAAGYHEYHSLCTGRFAFLKSIQGG